MPDTVLPPLDKVDPEKAWQPWQPTAADPWNVKWAGHFYRRAGFGATLTELRAAVANGYAATLERFFRTDEAVQEFHFLKAQLSEADTIRAWWIYLILNSRLPLREKMTLFWHNHFATSIAKVQRPIMMYNQNLTLRQHALGKFRPLLLDISRDPAMLVWLDSNSNVKGKPNENFARELMELFSLGVGNYTEADIREAARAFTGWQTEDNQFEFDEGLHDGGAKTVFGHKGNWNGDDIVRLVLDKPVAARFLVRKLYRFLISENAQPPDALLEPLAGAFRQSDYDIGALVKTMLSSRHFFSDHAYRQRIKSPVEFVIGTVRALWRNESDDVGAVPPAALVADLDNMGQELFAPPNVKGWIGGRAWLNSATILARHNFAQAMASGQAPASERQPPAVPVAAPPGAPPPKQAEKPEPPAHRDIAGLVQKEKITDPGGTVDFLVELLLQGGITDNARKKLIDYLSEGKPSGSALNRRIREIAHAVMTMPEYQLA
jgi:uncharacterized protein (DUF1800 family)